MSSKPQRNANWKTTYQPPTADLIFMGHRFMTFFVFFSLHLGPKVPKETQCKPVFSRSHPAKYSKNSFLNAWINFYLKSIRVNIESVLSVSKFRSILWVSFAVSTKQGGRELILADWRGNLSVIIITMVSWVSKISGWSCGLDYFATISEYWVKTKVILFRPNGRCIQDRQHLK